MNNSDVRIKVRSTKESEGSKGQRVISLYLTQETAAELAATVASFEGNEKGVKLMLNIYNNTNSTTGAAFPSTDIFVKPVQEFVKQSFKAVAKGTAKTATATNGASSKTREAYRNLNKTIE